MVQYIYQTVYCAGEYSDYCERVVGTSTSKKRALEFADQMAQYVNKQSGWWFDSDYIVIRKYELDTFNINLSKADRISGIEEPKELVVYESSGNQFGIKKYLEKVVDKNIKRV